MNWIWRLVPSILLLAVLTAPVMAVMEGGGATSAQRKLSIVTCGPIEDTRVPAVDILEQTADVLQPGLVVTYDSISAFRKDWPDPEPDEFSYAVQCLVTYRVTSVAEDGTVQGTLTTENVVFPDLQPQVYGWESSKNNLLFWVDPADPITGRSPPYEFVGYGPFTIGTQQWENAGTIVAQPREGVRYVLVFDAETGIVLHYSLTYPTEIIQAYLNSVNPP